MTNTETMYLVTSCHEHGVRVTADRVSQTLYREAAKDCLHETHFDPHGHHMDHVDDGTDCWACCPNVRVGDACETA